MNGFSGKWKKFLEGGAGILTAAGIGLLLCLAAAAMSSCGGGSAPPVAREVRYRGVTSSIPSPETEIRTPKSGDDNEFPLSPSLSAIAFRRGIDTIISAWF